MNKDEHDKTPRGGTQDERLLESPRRPEEFLHTDTWRVFRIMGERYRNRRKRFGLRLNLIAGLLNHQL